MIPGDSSRFNWQRRQLETKTASFRLAMDALCKKGLGAVRSLAAACDQRGHWQLLVTAAQCRQYPLVDGDTFSIHYVPRDPFKTTFEHARIQRFLSMLQQHGCHPHRIVTGTRTGPDLMIRLADGSPAIIEVKAGMSANQARGLLAARYDYLLDTFKLFYANESRAGCWHIWRVKRSGCEKVEPEALDG